MTVTVDNATSNDLAFSYLKQPWKGNVLRGEYLHMRCIPHIINLIVQDGLKLASYQLYVLVMLLDISEVLLLVAKI